MSAKDKKRLVILDTHAVLHRAYHALPDFASSRGEPTGALYGLITMLVKIVLDLHPDYIIAAFDLPQPTFRHLAYDDYKATRVKTDDALVAQIIRSRDVLEAFGIPLYAREGFEADDVIGTIAHELRGHKDIGVIIASGDMDTLQLVDGEKVRVFMPKKGLSETVMYDEMAVERRFGFGPLLIPDYKGLRGDPSDNIPGVKGIGEKTATQLITSFGSLENIYKALEKSPEKLVEAGIKAGIIEKLKEQKEGAEFSKMLAIIRRDAPIDFKLPEKEWFENLSKEKILTMLNEFDFRSLIPRVKTLFGEADLEASELESGTESSEPAEEVDEAEFAKIALAVSVLDSNIAKPTLDDIYRAGGTRVFEEAKKKILEDIKEKKLTFVYEDIELKLMPVLRAMEKRGVRIDRAFLADLSKKYHKELNTIAARIYQAAGGEFNINSPKQLGEILFDKLGLAVKNQKKTAGGARSTRESELEKMKNLHPIVGDILSHRELNKLLGTYIDALPN